jgi:hypothetical protein
LIGELSEKRKEDAARKQMLEHFTHRAVCELRTRGQVIKDHFVSQVLANNTLGDAAKLAALSTHALRPS